MEEYKKATIDMTDEIFKIMSECFNDPEWFVKFFFDKKLNLENCYVCTINQKVVSVLNFIPLKIRLNKHDFKGAYIYGACTLPQYRNNGYMTKLINYTQEVCVKEGYECTFLVPANKDLEKFYEKLGYTNFFQVKRVELKKNEILKLCENCYLSAVADRFSLCYSLVNKCRMCIYSDNAVLYSIDDLSFADELYKLNFGGLVDIDGGYGFCMPLNTPTLKIMDFTAIEGKEVELIKKITEIFPNYDNFIIETSPSNNFFKNSGSNYFKGMILPLTNLCETLVKQSIQDGNIRPYLGISFE